MAIVAKVLNGTNYTRDAGLQEIPTAIIDPVGGVRKGYKNECAVSTNSVATGMVYVPVTRDAVTPNEVFLVPVEITVATAVDTSGNGFIYVTVDQSKINDGSLNAVDGTGIATVVKGASMPSVNAVKLATLSGGVITDARDYAQISSLIMRQDAYFKVATGSVNAFVIADSNVKTLKDGTIAVFKANNAVTTAATANVNGTGAKAIRKNFNLPLIANDIKLNQIVVLRYNLTADYWEMISGVANTLTVTDVPSVGNTIVTGSEAGNAGDLLEVNAADTVRKFRPTFRQFRDQLALNPGGSTTLNTFNPRICRLSDTLFVCSSIGSSSQPVVFTMSLNKRTGVWTKANNVNVNTNTMNFTQEEGVLKILRTDATNFIVLFKRGYGSGAADGMRNCVIAGSVSGTTGNNITLGTAQELNTVRGGIVLGTPTNYADICMLATNKFAAIYDHTGGQYIRVLSISGTSISLGAEVQLTATATRGVPLGIAQLGTDKAVAIWWQTSGTTALATAFTVATATITKGLDYTINTGSVGCYGAVSPFLDFAISDKAYFSGAGNNLVALSASGTVLTNVKTSVGSSAEITIVAPNDFLMVSSGVIQPYHYDGSTAFTTFGSTFTPDVTSGTLSSSLALNATGEIAGISVTAGSGGVLNDFNMMCLAPAGRPYGVAQTIFTASASVKVITGGEAPLPSSVTVNSEVYASWGGVINQNHTEGVPLGMPKNTTTINLNITKRI